MLGDFPVACSGDLPVVDVVDPVEEDWLQLTLAAARAASARPAINFRKRFVVGMA